MTGDEVRDFRARHDLTRVQLAALMGVARGTVRNWEQGVRSVSAPADALLRRLDRELTAKAKRRQQPAEADQG